MPDDVEFGLGIAGTNPGIDFIDKKMGGVAIMGNVEIAQEAKMGAVGPGEAWVFNGMDVGDDRNRRGFVNGVEDVFTLGVRNGYNQIRLLIQACFKVEKFFAVIAASFIGKAIILSAAFFVVEVHRINDELGVRCLLDGIAQTDGEVYIAPMPEVGQPNPRGVEGVNRITIGRRVVWNPAKFDAVSIDLSIRRVVIVFARIQKKDVGPLRDHDLQ